ncbi:hypothetical protein FI667_g4479, partial [Globisporangium splendens]
MAAVGWDKRQIQSHDPLVAPKDAIPVDSDCFELFRRIPALQEHKIFLSLPNHATCQSLRHESSALEFIEEILQRILASRLQLDTLHQLIILILDAEDHLTPRLGDLQHRPEMHSSSLVCRVLIVAELAVSVGLLGGCS